MRIAFYAPLKPPDHPVASGDRAMARALIAALQLAGHDVTVVSRFRSYDRGDAARQLRIRDLGERLAERVLRRFECGPWRPDLWFTYHLYHKAPDWLGPAVCKRLGIPYVLAEASFAPKQAGGPWDLGHHSVAEAVRRADRIFEPNPADFACLETLVAAPDRLVALKPFLETAAFRAPDRTVCRAELSARYELRPGEPWLLTVAMMREDQKLASYRLLALALSDLGDLPWRLVITGAGPAEGEVRTAFARHGARVHWLGMLDRDTLRKFYRAADLYVWPAVKEAYGIAPLEAQAAGLTVVAGFNEGLAGIVADGETGLLTKQGDAAAFAAALRALVSDSPRRARMSEAAMLRTARDHDIGAAAGLLDRHLREVTGTSR